MSRCVHCRSSRHSSDRCRSAIAKLRVGLLTLIADATERHLTTADVVRELLDTSAALMVIAVDGTHAEKISGFERTARRRIEAQLEHLCPECCRTLTDGVCASCEPGSPMIAHSTWCAYARSGVCSCGSPPATCVNPGQAHTYDAAGLCIVCGAPKLAEEARDPVAVMRSILEGETS